MSLSIFYILVLIVAGVLLGLNWLISPNSPDQEKLQPYECGFQPIGQTRVPFSINYILVALLFLIFDLEVTVFYPIRISLDELGYYGITIALLFFILLTVGFAYELGMRAIRFDTSQD